MVKIIIKYIDDLILNFYSFLMYIIIIYTYIILEYNSNNCCIKYNN